MMIRRSCAILFTMLFVSVVAQAQVAVGIRGGISAYKMTLDKSLFDVKNRMGFCVGPTVKFGSLIGFDGSLLLDFNDAEVNGEPVYMKNLLVPVNVRINAGVGPVANIFLSAGPQLAFNIGETDFKLTDTSKYSIDKSTFSFNFGGGVRLSKLEVSANYNVECGRTADILSVGDAANKIAHSRAAYWRITAAMYF